VSRLILTFASFFLSLSFILIFCYYFNLELQNDTALKATQVIRNLVACLNVDFERNDLAVNRLEAAWQKDETWSSGNTFGIVHSKKPFHI